MKPQKLEPYHRSRHRAALHAWVVAATAVASIGLPIAALAAEAQHALHPQFNDEETGPSAAAQHAAERWIDALARRDRDAALSSMLPPADPDAEARLSDRLDMLSGRLAAGQIMMRPWAHRQAGHWALSAWRIDTPDAAAPTELLRPVALYNPVTDQADDPASQWLVVPNGYRTDTALAPLYNADYDTLTHWYAGLTA